MSYTQIQLDELKKSYAEGVLKVRHYNGQEITFDSREGLAARIAEIQASLSGPRSDTDKAFFPTIDRGYR